MKTERYDSDDFFDDYGCDETKERALEKLDEAFNALKFMNECINTYGTYVQRYTMRRCNVFSIEMIDHAFGSYDNLCIIQYKYVGEQEMRVMTQKQFADEFILSKVE